MSGLYEDAFLTVLQQGVESVAGHWGLSRDTRVSLLTVSENATFRADDPQLADPMILRVHRPAYHTPAEIESEIAWIEALRAEGVVATPAPIATATGARMAAFRHGDDTRHVAAFAFMSGAEPDPGSGLVEGFGLLGEISARLHGHARGWTPPPGFTRKTWDFARTIGDAPHWGSWRDSLGLDAQGAALLERCAADLQAKTAAYGIAPDRFGLIHADLRLANLLVDGNRLGVIDFDDCGFGWFVYDFAAAVSFLETESFIPDLADAWVAGYRRVAPLADVDVAMIPAFVMLRRMMLTAWIASHAETPTAQEAGLDAYTRGTLDLAERWLSIHGMSAGQRHHQ
ncbi:MAG: aminoglycoside phosphotransferase [Rhodobacteraceae bacterium]|nr:MAG: aminoglycoside phosphotransferase [Paracoccaceae bacterium]